MNGNSPQEACSKTQAQVRSINKEVDELEQRLCRLTERITPVLEPECPRPVGEGTDKGLADPPCSEHVSELKRIAARITALSRYVHDVFDRIEV